MHFLKREIRERIRRRKGRNTPIKKVEEIGQRLLQLYQPKKRLSRGGWIREEETSLQKGWWKKECEA